MARSSAMIDVLHKTAITALYHQTDRVESSEKGDSSTVLVTRTGKVALEDVKLTCTPETVQHMSNVYRHVLAVKVQLIS
jgi:hypothetical protein